MSQLEAMRDVLMNAGYSRTAVEAALSAPRCLRDDIVLAVLPRLVGRGLYGDLAVDQALEIANKYMERR